MIRIIGDTHGDLDCFTDGYMHGQSGWGPEDKLIVTGDFGFVMYGEENVVQFRPEKKDTERRKLDALAEKPYEILFVDGNHEGFDYLEQYPQQMRYGAPVRRIRDNIFWLQRGYIYTIEGKSFFCMGGAHSMNQAELLAEEAVLRERLPEKSETEELLRQTKRWFPQELPTNEEYHRAGENLAKAGMQVDYILTHTAPRSFVRQIIGKTPDHHDGELTGFLEWVYYEVAFKQWFFGHFHEDLILRERMISCLKRLHQIP